jgi:HEPN/RES N-terminal domain 1
LARGQIEPDSYDLSDERLKAMSAEEQQEAMEAWFRLNYEDPAQRTPYESAEGGYQWIGGGPYDALEELGDRFSGVVPDDVIQALADRLSADMPDWASTPATDDIDAPEDELPPDTPPDVRARYEELLGRHDEWLREHPLPEDDSRARAEALRLLDAAADALRAIRGLYVQGQPRAVGKGHNNPPRDLEDEAEASISILPPQGIDEIVAAVEDARPELMQPEPDIGKVHAAASKLASAAIAVGLWLAKKADLAADECSKAFGKTLGITVAGSVSIAGAITVFSLFRAAADALQAWIIPHLPF